MDSRIFFGFEWGGWFFISCCILLFFLFFRKMLEMIFSLFGTWVVFFFGGLREISGFVFIVG